MNYRGESDGGEPKQPALRQPRVPGSRKLGAKRPEVAKQGLKTKGLLRLPHMTAEELR